MPTKTEAKIIHVRCGGGVFIRDDLPDKMSSVCDKCWQEVPKKDQRPLGIYWTCVPRRNGN